MCTFLFQGALGFCTLDVCTGLCSAKRFWRRKREHGTYKGGIEICKIVAQFCRSTEIALFVNNSAKKMLLMGNMLNKLPQNDGVCGQKEQQIQMQLPILPTAVRLLSVFLSDLGPISVLPCHSLNHPPAALIHVFAKSTFFKSPIIFCHVQLCIWISRGLCGIIREGLIIKEFVIPSQDGYSEGRKSKTFKQ